MQQKILFVLLLLFICTRASGQSISLDKTGKLISMSIPKDTAGTIKVKVSTKLQPPFFYRDSMMKLLSIKIDSTISHLENPDLFYLEFSKYLWGNPVCTQLIQDLNNIKNWIAAPSPDPKLVHLQPFFKQLKLFRNADQNEWFTLNDAAAGKTLHLSQTNFDSNTNAFTIRVAQNNLYNKMLADLFNDTYTNNKYFRALPEDSFDVVISNLKALNERATALSKYGVNDMTGREYSEIGRLHHAIRTDTVFKTLQESPYFKNWIWLREGELLLNPYELKARDTAKTKPGGILPRSRNVSKLKALTLKDETRNKILLAYKKDHERNIHFFRMGSEVKNNTDEISGALTDLDNVKVNMHNTAINETLELRLVKSTPHNGMNNTLIMIDSGFSVLSGVISLMNPAAAMWKTVLSNLTINKSSKDCIGLTDKENHFTLQIIHNPGNMDNLVAAVQKDLEKKGTYNKYLLQDSQDSLIRANATPQAYIRNKDKQALESYACELMTVYARKYQDYIDRRNTLTKDSMVIANIYMIIAESNLPPKSVALHPYDGDPLYRTEILETGNITDDVINQYQVKSFMKKENKTDSAVVADFKVKSGKRQIFTTSAGIAFTLPNQYYAENSVTYPASGAPEISTSRPTVSVVAGLHIHFKRISMLDNDWIGHKSTVLSRFSAYIGLNIPDVTKHFYPGLSYDVIPGIKFITGWHFYRHTKYDIQNNVVQKETKVLRQAGPFASLSIDPRIALKAFGLIK